MKGLVVAFDSKAREKITRICHTACQSGAGVKLAATTYFVLWPD